MYMTYVCKRCTMCNAHIMNCILSIIQYTLYNVHDVHHWPTYVHCTLYMFQFISITLNYNVTAMFTRTLLTKILTNMYIVQCTIYSVHYTVYNVHCTLYIIHRSVKVLECNIPWLLFYILYIVYTVYTIH